MKARIKEKTSRMRYSAGVLAGLLLLGSNLPAEEPFDARAMVGEAGDSSFYLQISNELVSLTAHDAIIRDVLNAFARESGLIVITHALLAEPITIEFDSLTLTEALERILRNHSYLLYAYAGDVSQGTLWVFTDEPHREPAQEWSRTRIEVLQTDILSDNPRTRAAAIRGLRKLANDAVVAPISLALIDDEQQLRLKAIYALADIGGNDAAAALAAASADENAYVRAESAYALGMIGGNMAIQILEHALRDPDIDVRQSAVEAFSDIGGGQAARALGIVLTDTNAGLRLEAVEALEEIGGQSAMRLLAGALSDPDDTVRQAANAALAELMNQSQR